MFQVNCGRFIMHWVWSTGVT